MIRKILSAVYIVALLAVMICTPLSAIFAVCKLCGATPLSWIACCVPLLIAIACLPFMIIAKLIIDASANINKKRG